MTSSLPNHNSDQWWVFHAKAGWLVLDRQVKRNSAGSTERNLIFVKCSNWSLLSVRSDRCFPPLCIYAPNYLNSLSAAKCQDETRLWQGYQQQFLDRRTRLGHSAENFEKHQQDKERRKQAKEKREREKLDKAREFSLRELNRSFETDFLQSRAIHQNLYSGYISATEFEYIRSRFVQSWTAKQPGLTMPDEEQAAAIGAVDGHTQVVARAGSGKTTTLVQRAVFLQKHCGVLPEQMLLLAFNNKAAKDVGKQLTEYLGAGAPNAMTFHALASGLVRPGRILVDEKNGEENRKRFVQDIIDAFMENPRRREQLCSLLIKYYREDWESILSEASELSPKALLLYRRALPKRGIDGRQYRSRGEKAVADFLFEHGIVYKYEKVFWFDGVRNRPDFTVEGEKGVIIEFFGMSSAEYRESIRAKRANWQTRKDYTLLELFGTDFASGTLLDKLKTGLEAHGVTCCRLSEEELWERINPDKKAIRKFTDVAANFIGRCCKLSLTPEQLEARIAAHKCISEAENMFLPLVLEFYKTYLRQLEEGDYPDFDILIRKAAEKIRAGQTCYKRTDGSGDLKKLRYVFIDEYQDFSDLFHGLTKALREQNPNVQFFCVGDDWQAINGYAGSDLSFYKDFGQYFQPSYKLDVSTNYRSANRIVELSNALMQTSGKPARAHKKAAGEVLLADLHTFSATDRETELHGDDELTPALLRLIGASFGSADGAVKTGKDAGVMLLNRTKNLREPVNCGANTRHEEGNGLDKFVAHLRLKLPPFMRQWIGASTAHSYKGGQKDMVVVLDAVSSSYPLIHPESALTRILGDSVKKTIAEERRLFYVALTRAVTKLVIITRVDAEPMAEHYKTSSPFLEELSQRIDIPKLRWDDYSPLVDSAECIAVKIGNNDRRKKTSHLKVFLGRDGDGYVWIPRQEIWYKSFPADGFSPQAYLAQSSWVPKADGVTIKFYNDREALLAAYTVVNGKFLEQQT